MKYIIELPDRITPAIFDSNFVDQRAHLMHAFTKAQPLVECKLLLGGIYKTVVDGPAAHNEKVTPVAIYAVEDIC